MSTTTSSSSSSSSFFSPPPALEETIHDQQQQQHQKHKFIVKDSQLIHFAAKIQYELEHYLSILIHSIKYGDDRTRQPTPNHDVNIPIHQQQEDFMIHKIKEAFYLLRMKYAADNQLSSSSSSSSPPPPFVPKKEYELENTLQILIAPRLFHKLTVNEQDGTNNQIDYSCVQTVVTINIFKVSGDRYNNNPNNNQSLLKFEPSLLLMSMILQVNHDEYFQSDHFQKQMYPWITFESPKPSPSCFCANNNNPENNKNYCRQMVNSYDFENMFGYSKYYSRNARLMNSVRSFQEKQTPMSVSPQHHISSSKVLQWTTFTATTYTEAVKTDKFAMKLYPLFSLFLPHHFSQQEFALLQSHLSFFNNNNDKTHMIITETTIGQKSIPITFPFGKISAVEIGIITTSLAPPQAQQAQQAQQASSEKEEEMEFNQIVFAKLHYDDLFPGRHNQNHLCSSPYQDKYCFVVLEKISTVKQRKQFQKDVYELMEDEIDHGIRDDHDVFSISSVVDCVVKNFSLTQEQEPEQEQEQQQQQQPYPYPGMFDFFRKSLLECNDLPSFYKTSDYQDKLAEESSKKKHRNHRNHRNNHHHHHIPSSVATAKEYHNFWAHQLIKKNFLVIFGVQELFECDRSMTQITPSNLYSRHFVPMENNIRMLKMKKFPLDKNLHLYDSSLSL